MNTITRKFNLLLILAGMLLAQTAWAQNAIETIGASQQGSDVVLKLTTSRPLDTVPASFNIANPPRIAFDFPGVANALGRSSQSFNEGDLRSVSLVQVGNRTRVVLNLKQMHQVASRIEGKDLYITIDGASSGGVSKAEPVAAQNFAEAKSQSAGYMPNIRDINFRRGSNGEGRVVVDLSDSNVGIDIRQQGSNLVVEFMKTILPETLRRRMDVTDFATPITTINTLPQGENIRMVISPKGLWEHNAYQSDNQFVVEVKQVVENPNKLVQGSGKGYQGEKLSLNFQNIDVRAVLQVIADFTDFNIITSDTVGGSLTLRLKDVPWDQALDIILQAKSLGMRKNGNVISIAPDDELRLRDKERLESEAIKADLEPLQTESIVLNYHKANEVIALLQSGGQSDRGFLSKRGKVSADERSNMIFVTDIPARLEAVRRMVREIDQSPRQVLIEARVVEATKTFSRDLGVRLGLGKATPWRMNDGGAQVGFGKSSFGSFTPSVAESGGGSFVQDGFGSMSLSIFNSSVTRFLNLELEALESDGRGRVVSSPRILTANQGNATIKQGSKIPIRVCDTEAGVRECDVEFVDALLSLNVTPSITPDGRVQLTVKVNKDRPDFSFTVDNTPLIETKEVITTITVDNGGTVLLGGVYEEQDLTSEDRVPVLGEVPIVGALFRATSKTQERKELLVFITPRLISDSLTVR